jgi:hypothetical protein
MTSDTIQWGVFAGLTLVMALATWWQVNRMGGRSSDSNSEYFLAGRNLTWPFVAGSITLTNLSTDQLVGMNGNQMLLLAWWELSAVAGLVMLAFVFLPIYYRNNCTTTTELLERKYGSKHLRATVSVLFLLGNVFIYLPIMAYTGALFLKTMFVSSPPLLVMAGGIAVVGAAYTILGGLRAVAVYDTLSGVGVLGMAAAVTILAMAAIGFDFSGIPTERLSMIGGARQSDPLADAADGHDLHPDVLLVHQPDHHPAGHGLAQPARGAEGRDGGGGDPHPVRAGDRGDPGGLRLQAVRRYRRRHLWPDCRRGDAELAVRGLRRLHGRRRADQLHLGAEFVCDPLRLRPA